MCRRRPDSLEAFLLVSGVGKAKQEKYGAQFLDLLARYRTASSPASVNHRTDPEPRSTPHFATAAPESPTAAVAACVDPYRRWESREDDQLRKEFKSGLSVEEIAKLHQRTSGAILARLKRLDPDPSGIQLSTFAGLRFLQISEQGGDPTLKKSGISTLPCVRGGASAARSGDKRQAFKSKWA